MEEEIISLLEYKSIVLFNTLNNLLDDTGQQILYQYDHTINEIYEHKLLLKR